MPRALNRRLSPLALLLGVALALPPAPASAQALAPGIAPGLAGAYLSARQARDHNDFQAVTEYLRRLIAAAPGDLGLREDMIVSAFSAGDVNDAVANANEMVALDPQSRAAALVLMAQAFQQQDYAAALQSADGVNVHVLTNGVARAFALLGQGSMADALAALDQVGQDEGMRDFALYCRALALALVGDAEGALALIEDPNSAVADSLNRRGFIVYAQLLGQAERFDQALALLAQIFPGSTDPVVLRMIDAYSRQQALPFDVITSPADAMAEVFAVMANAMRAAQNTHDALVYGQAAAWVNPRLSDAVLLIAQVFQQLEQPDLALEAYARIPQDDVFTMAAQIGRAAVLEDTGAVDEAQSTLTTLAADNPQSFAALLVLGDFLRRNGQNAAAVDAYSDGIAAMTAAGVEPGWTTFFSRAVAFERTGQWPQAEADFRAALAIDPDQPTVLNYLGYSLVERGENLDEALPMIERAVAGDPDSGAIVDSLAWALFRLGRYDEAVAPMERALQLLPADAILNDHLGDVYWAVGRQREARFHWHRALSFGENPDLDADRVRRKLQDGLDAVRAAEGLAPLHPDQ